MSIPKPEKLTDFSIQLPTIPAEMDPQEESAFWADLPEDIRPDHHLYEQTQKTREAHWAAQVARFEADPTNVYEAYGYVAHHPMFWSFWLQKEVHERYLVDDQGWGAVCVDPHMICPLTGRVEKDPTRNTELQWWYEFGPHLFRERCHGHDWQLDGGGPTYESCILEVANKVHDYYGNDRRQVVRGTWKDVELPNE